MVNTKHGNSEEVMVKVGAHQVMVMNPLLRGCYGTTDMLDHGGIVPRAVVHR